LVAALIVAADQITKTVAVDHLQLDRPVHVIGPAYWLLTLNRGAAFSMGAGATPIIEAAVVVLVVGLLLVTGRVSRDSGWRIVIGFGLLLGGALSNLGDRLFRPEHRAVVDFVQAVGWWPIFNVADASIVIGVIVVALTWWTDG
jgi:signal peptidase II